MVRRKMKIGGGDSLRLNKGKTLFFALVFLVPVVTGLAIAINRMPEIVAAIANFFVTEPVKGANINRGFSVNQTSQLNVYDTDAVNGYAVKARLDAGIDPALTVRLWSANSTVCTEAAPCLLGTSDIVVHTNLTDSATADPGDTIDFDVRIDSSLALEVGQHNVEIIYTKAVGYNMQTFSSAVCDAMPVYPAGGAEIDLADVRDGKIYKIRKLADNKCWMVDNLAIEGTRTLDEVTSDIASGTYTLLETDTADPNSKSYCSSLSTAVYRNKCGMLYKWGTAVAGNNPSIGDATDSICPKNWRMPISGEYITLQTAMNAQVPGSFSTTSAVVAGYWRGLLTGTSSTSITYSGTRGYAWMATALDSTSAYRIIFNEDGVQPNNNTGDRATQKLPMRCLAR